MYQTSVYRGGYFRFSGAYGSLMNPKKKGAATWEYVVLDNNITTLVTLYITFTGIDQKSSKYILLTGKSLISKNRLVEYAYPSPL